MRRTPSPSPPPAAASAEVLGARYHYAGGHDLEIEYNQALRRQAFGFEHLRQVARVGDVALVHPHAAQDAAGDAHRGLAAVVHVDRDDQLGGVVGVDRKELRLHLHRHVQVLGKTPELHQPVGLALRRTLGQRQAARTGEDRAEVDLAPDYCCFPIPDTFVVGYGLDFNGEYRHLPYIAALDETDL